MNSSTRKQRILSHWLIELVLERWFATSCNEERKKDPSRWLKWTQLEFYICISHLVHIINMKNCGFIIVSCPFQLILIAIPVRSLVCTLFFLDMIGTANTKKNVCKIMWCCTRVCSFELSLWFTIFLCIVKAKRELYLHVISMDNHHLHEHIDAA